MRLILFLVACTPVIPFYFAESAETLKKGGVSLTAVGGGGGGRDIHGCCGGGAARVSVGVGRQMEVELRTVGLISASGRGNERDNQAAPEFPAKQEFQPDSICAREELREMLLSAMRILPER